MRQVRVDAAGPLPEHPGMQMTRVLLADGHRSFVEALAMRLDAEPGLQVVGVVVQPEEALRIVTAQPVDDGAITDEEVIAHLTNLRPCRCVMPGSVT